MRLLVCNASPRAGKSNTDLLLDALLAGFRAAAGEVVGRYHLVRRAHLAEAARRFTDADAVLIAYPLYVDALPAPGLELLAALEAYVGRPGNPALLFLVQSGFPEALHSRPVERLHERLARRLGAPYLGTIVRPGVEGIQAQPPWLRRRHLAPFGELGRELARGGRLDAEVLARLARPEALPRGPLASLQRAAMQLVVGAFWNAQLRRNGALAARDARPYEVGAPR